MTTSTGTAPRGHQVSERSERQSCGSRRPPVRWARHLAEDVDEAVVHRLVHGIPVDGATTYERQEAVRLLRAQRLSQRDIGRRLGIDDNQVLRHLYRLGLVARGVGLARQREAARRRTLVARLNSEGLARSEIAALLHVGRWVIDSDFNTLAPTGTNRRSSRSRAELLRDYGHLLTELEEATA